MALALVVFGAYDTYPFLLLFSTKRVSVYEIDQYLAQMFSDCKLSIEWAAPCQENIFVGKHFSFSAILNALTITSRTQKNGLVEFPQKSVKNGTQPSK